MRGFWHIIESALAGIVIFGFIAVLGRTYIFLPGPSDLDIIGYEALKSLDDQGLLRGYAVDGDYGGLNSLISLGRYNHSIRICDHDGTCLGPFQNVTGVWTSVYLIAGNETYEPYEVRLHIWQQ